MVTLNKRDKKKLIYSASNFFVKSIKDQELTLLFALLRPAVPGGVGCSLFCADKGQNISLWADYKGGASGKALKGELHPPFLLSIENTSNH